MAARCSNGDLPMIVGFIVIRWRPAGVPAVTAGCLPIVVGTPAGHRPEILSFAERIGRWPNSLPAAAGRRELLDFYDMVQGRENPPMTCRCQKVGIDEKFTGHRAIYKACDIGIKTVCWAQNRDPGWSRSN